MYSFLCAFVYLSICLRLNVFISLFVCSIVNVFCYMLDLLMYLFIVVFTCSINELCVNVPGGLALLL